MPAGHPFGKVVHHLADRYFYRRHLEIATSTTGFYYAAIDRGRFDDCRRLLYRCPAEFDDGLAVDYRCAGLDIGPALAAMLVDPFHAYRESSRHLAAAFALLEPGGALVVHDCLPPDEALAGPELKRGPWCGLTYKAFLDFVLERRDLRCLTVDTDYGCGVIRRAVPRALAAGAGAPPPGRVLAGARRRCRRLAPVRAEPRRTAEPDFGQCLPRRPARPRLILR
jgi:hypothetical protein